MTATLTARPLFDSSDSLLRFALRVDAALCAATGLLAVVIADPLSGSSATNECSAGAALACFGVALYVLAAAPELRRIGVAIVTANVLIAAGALVALATGVLPLTGAGAVTSPWTVAVTICCATAQYFGVRRLA